MTLPRLAAVAATALLALGGLGVAQAQPDEPHHPDPGAPGPSAATGPSTEPGPPPAGPLTSIDKDGTYKVGTEILPGTYSSAGPVDGGACYWKRDNNDQVPDNALTKKPQVVRIEATDTAFTTRDCQPWQQTNAAPPPQASPTDLLGQLGSFIGKGILSGGPR